jgi:hypothetical protein
MSKADIQSWNQTKADNRIELLKLYNQFQEQAISFSMVNFYRISNNLLAGVRELFGNFGGFSITVCCFRLSREFCHFKSFMFSCCLNKVIRFDSVFELEYLKGF